jgi:hypothetical protein
MFDAAKNLTVGKGAGADLTAELEGSEVEAGAPPVGAAVGSVGKSLQRNPTLVPDLPRWVEVRSMLLSGGSILGTGSSDPPAFVVLQAAIGQMAVVGHPSHQIIRAAAEQVDEIIAQPENVDWTAAALPDWTGEPATIHVLGRSARLPDVPPGTVRRLTAEELSSAPGLPSELREELLVKAMAGSPITAAFAGGRPVAFCYSGSVTEHWWDISIDSIEPYRRQGYAARCVSFCVEEMARAGKQPVWGAFVSNQPSLRLAAKLGFEPVDTIHVFSRRA